MADLTPIETKIAEVMREEAAETEQRCSGLAAAREGKETAMNEKVRDSQVAELVDFALPIQQRHLEQARAGALELAREEVAAG